MTNEKNQEKRLPEQKFRAGPVCVTVWNNKSVDKEGVEREYKTFQFERSYKDAEGWKTTNSLRIHDLPKAALVLNRAYEESVLAPTKAQEEVTV
jgi:hypothetical protein